MKAERPTLGPLINAEELYYYLSYFARVCVCVCKLRGGVGGPKWGRRVQCPDCSALHAHIRLGVEVVGERDGGVHL